MSVTTKTPTRQIAQDASEALPTSRTSGFSNGHAGGPRSGWLMLVYRVCFTDHTAPGIQFPSLSAQAAQFALP